MTKEEKQIETKLRELEAEMRRNERLMRKAFMRYEDLISENAALVAEIDALLVFRVQRRRNALKMVLHPKPISRNGGQSEQFFRRNASETSVQLRALFHQVGK